jgi:hypothetical protein
MGRDHLHPEIWARRSDIRAGEIDWMLLESKFWEGEGQDMVSCSTLLISCAHAPSTCGTLGVLADNGRQTYSKYGRTNFHPEVNWGEACSTESVIEFAVVYVDEQSTLTLHQVGQLIQSLKDSAVCFVTVVCPDAAIRRAIANADAFVVGSVETTIHTAGILAQLVCAVTQSPAMYNCIDATDIASVLCGSADTPNVLAEAIWLRKPVRIKWLASADLQAMASSQAVIVDPGLIHAGLADWSDLRRHLHTLNPSEEFELLVGGACGGGFQFWCGSRRATLIRMLCKPG